MKNGTQVIVPQPCTIIVSISFFLSTPFSASQSCKSRKLAHHWRVDEAISLWWNHQQRSFGMLLYTYGENVTRFCDKLNWILVISGWNPSEILVNKIAKVPMLRKWGRNFPCCQPYECFWLGNFQGKFFIGCHFYVLDYQISSIFITIVNWCSYGGWMKHLSILECPTINSWD